MNATAAPNGTSTIGQRAQYLLDQHWRGDRNKMADVCKVGQSVLVDILRGKARPDQEGQFLKNCGKLRGIDPRWLGSGEGQPFAQFNVAAAAEPPDPVVARTRLALDFVFRDVANAARLTRIPPDRIRACVERGVRPSDDDLIAVANAGQVSIDWLMSGDGEMLIPPPPETPQEAPEAVEAVPERDAAVAALAGRLEALEKTVLVRLGGLDQDNRTRARDQGLLADKIDALAASLAESDALYGRLSRSQSEVMKSAQAAYEALAGRVAAIEAKIDGFRKDVGDHEREEQEFRKQVVDAGVAEAKSYRDQVQKILEGADGVIAATTRGLIRGFETRLAALEKKQPAPPKLRRESELKPEESIAVKDWAELEGEHREFFRNLEKRKRASVLLGQQYTIARPDHPEGEFRVCDLRLVHDYLRQLPPDGKANLADWMAFFRHAHAQRG